MKAPMAGARPSGLGAAARLQAEHLHRLVHHLGLRLQRTRGRRELLDHGRVLLRDRVELAHGLIDLPDAAGLLARGVRDVADERVDLLHRAHHLAHRLAGAVDQLAAAPHLVRRVLDQGLDLLCCFQRALREAAHLGRHHGEAAPLLTRPRRFHRRIERQDVGLERDAVDDLDDFADARRAVADLAHGGDDLRHGAVAVARHGGRALRELRGLLRGAGALRHGAVHLFHGRRRLLQVAGLRFGARGQVLVAAGDLVAGDLHTLELVAHVGHHGLQIHIELVQCRGEFAELGRSAHRQACGEVTRGHGVGEAHGLRQRLHGLAAQGPGGEQGCRQQWHRQGDVGCGAQASADLADRQAGQCQRHADPANGAAQAGPQRAAQPARQAFVHHLAAPQAHRHLATLALGAHPRIQGLGRLHLLACGFGAHGHIAHGLAVLHDGRGVGHHPVVVAVLAAVLHQGRPGRAAAQRLPHVAKGLGGHVGVSHDVVRLAHEFIAAEAADRNEGGVAVGDVALQIGGGDQGHAIRDDVFLLGDGQVGAHGTLVRRGGSWFGRLAHVISACARRYVAPGSRRAPFRAPGLTQIKVSRVRSTARCRCH